MILAILTRFNLSETSLKMGKIKNNEGISNLNPFLILRKSPEIWIFKALVEKYTYLRRVSRG